VNETSVLVLPHLASGIRERTHEARADLFVRLLAPRRGVRLLDLGGGDGTLAARIVRRVPLEVVVADIDERRRLARERHGFDEVALEADGPLPFADAAFDIVLCNSVIEHVTLPKDECRDARIAEAEWRARAFARQRAFAQEIRRVGRAYFVQTPHRAFPIDAHTWLPFTNFLSHEGARRLVRATDRWWVKKCGVADWNLLGPADMRALFPDASIHVERVAGLPKSIIAWKRG
jgi:SAM-dependent methyltransferase